MNTEGSMVVYLHHYINNPNEIKFGQTFVLPGEDIETAVINRVRQSLGVKKRDYDKGKVVIDGFWDVTEIATAVNRNYAKAKMDDYIRPVIGHRVDPQDEHHAVHFEQALLKINDYINEWNAPKPRVGLSPWQYNATLNVLTALADGMKVTLAELCARFGKTIWAAALARETDIPITIIASYVLTSFASFAKDLKKYEQFRNMVVVDSASSTYQADVQTALDNGQQVVVFLSMVGGALRQDRIDYLFNLPQQRLVFIDEADYGAHTKNQTEPFVAAVNENDQVVLMTGTNGDRACGNWKIDHYLSVVYPELVMYKRAPSKIISNKKLVKNFDVDYTRVDVVVDTEFYQLNVAHALEAARRSDPELLSDESLLPSWSKFAKNPARAKGFWMRVLEAMFLGKHNHDELNLSYQIDVPELFQVSMMFMPGSTSNENLKKIVEYTQQALMGWTVLEISGAGVYNGRKITNRNAEEITLEVIARAKESNTPVLILSRGMAQRSYSVGDITNLFLCFDGGDSGATTQKISRALTSADVGKVGRIYSLSFDPNRDDKFDTIMLSAAQNIAERDGTEVADELRKVISTIDIFSCTEDGRAKIDPDNYLHQLLERCSISRIVGKQANLGKLSYLEIMELASGNGKYNTFDKTDATQKGKTYKDVLDKSKQPKIDVDSVVKEVNDNYSKARKVITTIVEHLHCLPLMTNQDNIKDSLLFAEQDGDDIGKYITDEFGASPRKILDFFERGVINYKLTSLQSSAKLRELRK